MSNIYLHIKSYSKSRRNRKVVLNTIVLFYVSLVLYMLKKIFDQLCLVIANLAHYVLKLGNNWLYKRYWKGKVFQKICEFFFSGLPAEMFFHYLICRKQVAIYFFVVLMGYYKKYFLSIFQMSTI